MRGLPPIDRAARNRRIELYEQRCRDNGAPRTATRLAVLKAILRLNWHPTADEVFALPALRRIRVSRATVYRALESLARLGLITKACHPGDVIRYDIRLEPHHHLVCLRCDAVEDIKMPAVDNLPLPDVSVSGFEVKEYRVQFRGICRACKQKEP